MTPEPIETAPKDGTKFLGDERDDWIAMFWHPTFGEFVSTFSRMELARGMTFADTGLSYCDHHPVVHKPTRWMPLIPATKDIASEERLAVL